MRDLLTGLKETLKEALPGELAQREMMAEPENKLRFNYKAKRGAIECGVLILLYQNSQNDWHFPLILRHEYNGAHSGQVALPGGRFEPHDDGLIHTAVRETVEEIGVRGSDISIIGSLTELFIPVSNYLVFPSVGYIPYEPSFIPEEREVKKVIPARLTDLVDDSIVKRKTIEIRQVKVNTPFFDLENQFVWGATAMILSEFKQAIKSI